MKFVCPLTSSIAGFKNKGEKNKGKKEKNKGEKEKNKGKNTRMRPKGDDGKGLWQ